MKVKSPEPSSPASATVRYSGFCLELLVTARASLLKSSNQVMWGWSLSLSALSR